METTDRSVKINFLKDLTERDWEDGVAKADRDSSQLCVKLCSSTFRNTLRKSANKLVDSGFHLLSLWHFE